MTARQVFATVIESKCQVATDVADYLEEAL